MSELPMYRETARYMLASVWNLSKERITDLVENACARLSDSHERRLRRSFQEYERTIDTVLMNGEYAREEQANVFGAVVVPARRKPGDLERIRSDSF